MHRKLVPAALVLALLFAPGLILAAEITAETASAPSSLERLTQVGKLWGMVRYLHPYIAYKEIDWDAALVAAVPEIREAKTREEYRAAVEGMLAALGDPLTKVVDVPAPSSSSPAPASASASAKKPEAPPVIRRLEDGVVAFDLGPYLAVASPRDLGPQYQALRQEVGQARAVVVDLRSSDAAGGYGRSVPAVLEQSASFLAGRRCQGPGERYLMHSGYRPQFGSLTGGYYSGFLTLASNAYGPAPGSAESPKRVVFLVDQGNRSLPNLVSALQACGDGRVVSVGKLAAQPAAATRSFPLGEGLTANVRVSEVLPLPGWNGLAADVELPEGTSPEAAYQAALAEARRPAAETPRTAPFTPLPDFVLRLDKTYREMVEPDLPHRQLAVIRAWNVIHHFYPYLHLLDDWDAVLPEFLARMETAATGRDYAQAVQEMMTRVADSHTGVWGHPEISKELGNGWLPLEVRWIEGAAVVRVVGEEARPSGILPGDAILAVDGEPTADLFERRSRTMPASTPAGRLARICREILRGPDGSTAVLSVQSPGGAPREVRLQRGPGQVAFFPPSDGETVRILPGNLGYADLTRLTVPEVDAMFEKVKDTRALIFDMRGYPLSTAGEIAARINTRKARIGAQFRRSQVSAFSIEETASGYYFSQPLTEDPRGLPLYTRPTVMLIDDQAISAAEHTGLFLEAANGTRFIGTPTAGANGDITRFTLPGGINVMFTGHDVRHADGRQLQRIGLLPEVEAAPTRQGLRDGRDEVLERAVRFLEEELGGEESGTRGR